MIHDKTNYQINYQTAREFNNTENVKQRGENTFKLHFNKEVKQVTDK